MTEPTDAELKAMWQLHAADIGGIFYYARAVLEKWGQSAQETKGRKVFVCTHCDGVYADQPVTQCDCMPDENTFTEGWICFVAPAQAAEPVAWLRNTTDPQPHAVTNLKYRSAVDAEAGVEYIPVFAAPQPVALVPLTDEQTKALMQAHRTAMYMTCKARVPECGEFAAIAQDLDWLCESFGIKGGQHAQGNQ